jgi:MYXO-CTERM domain-containing protein
MSSSRDRDDVTPEPNRGTMPGMRRPALLLVASALGAGPASAQPSTWNFESVASRPLALSSDGTRLYAVNTPDAHLEVLDVSGATPVLVTSVSVGLEPVAVALRDDGEAWVVNQLSDSVSVVDLRADPPRVVRTLLVGDEPSDIVFAGPGGARAFVTTARRGQNTTDPRGAFDQPGIGRAQVWVLDAAHPGSALLPAPIAVLTLFSDKPRALAVTPDGNTVYASGFLTGNRTTTIAEGIVCNDFPSCVAEDGMTAPGGLPPPRENAASAIGPQTGLIVRFDAPTGKWVDELARDWSAFVRFSLPDYDVFRIDAAAATPTVTAQIAGVGTVLYAMAVNPQTGRLYVANTEAQNHVRFEGPGTYVRAHASKPAGEPASVRGHLHEARVTIVDGTTVTPRRLNTHLDYAARPQPADAAQKSLAQPVGLAVSADGQRLYVAAFGSGALAVLPTAALEAGTYAPSAADHVALTAGGPSGVVLDETRGRAFVATRFDDGVSVVSLADRAETAHVRLHTPEPAAVYWGRPFLYDARATSSTGEAACGSCHVFGDLDALAWDLGNPDGDVVASSNPAGPIGSQQPFHPLKGPMTTQTLRGLATHGPMHWRGDRTGGGPNALDEHLAFEAFNVAFDDLLGRDAGKLSDADMALFADFALSIVLPPNPARNLDRSLRADEASGRDIFLNRPGVDTVTTCNGCHTLDPEQGFFGTPGKTTFENEPQELKVPHLRNLYQKVGMFGMPAVPFFIPGDNGDKGPQVRGFGFLHDGSTDTVFRFVHASVFVNLNSDVDRRELEAFLMAFDSDLAPIVGQEVTVDAASGADVVDRVDLLAARAATPFVLLGAPTATECDLVVHGVVDGEARGFLRQADGRFTSDRAAETPRSLDDLLGLAMNDSPLTFLCAPPGAGVRMALDRDEDGARDRDELDMGRSPIDRPIPVRPGGPIADAGVSDGPTADAAAADAPAAVPPDAPAAVPDAPTTTTASTGCCSTSGAANAPGSLLLVAVVLAVLRRRRVATESRDVHLGAGGLP